MSDKIVSNPVKDYGVNDGTEFVEDYICQFLWQRLFIGFDGRTQPCSNSVERLYIGDARKQSIKEIWQSEKMNRIRQDHIKARINNYFACANCSYRVKSDFQSQLEADWNGWDPDQYDPSQKAEKIA